MTAIEKVIAIAENEVGYLEKKTNSQLDDKAANAGSNNYTKYARDLYPSLQGQAWRDINGHRYYFNPDGYAMKDWNKIGDKWYYFEPTEGAPLECALYVTDADGVQAVGSFQ